MKTLYLMRHAVAQAADPALADFARPLSDVGVAAAQAMGRAMRTRGWLPATVLCSAARRAAQTWECIAAELGDAPAPRLLRGLYLAPPSRLLDALQRQPEEHASTLVIAHNPGLQSLARTLAGAQSDGVDLARLRQGFAPATLAVLEFSAGPWAQIRSEPGRLTYLLQPTDFA